MARTKGSRGKESNVGNPEDEFDDFYSSSGSSEGQLKLLVLEVIGRWPWALLGLVLGVLGAYYYLSKAPEIYESSAAMLFSEGAGGNGGSRAVLENNTLLEGFKDPEFLMKVAVTTQQLVSERKDLRGKLIPPKTNWFPDWTHSWLGKDNTPAAISGDLPPSQLAGLMSSWTNVSFRRDTFYVDVQVKHPIPEISAMVANSIAIEFANTLKEKRDIEGKKDKIFYERGSTKAGKELTEKKNSLANYVTALASLEALEKEEEAFSELNRVYLEKHPKFKKGQAALKEKRTNFLREFSLVRNSKFDREYWEEHRVELDQLNLDEATKLKIARRLFTARETLLVNEIARLEAYFKKMFDTYLVADAASVADLQVDRLSVVPNVPSSPKRSSVMANGALLGIGTGLLFAFCLVKLDTKIHTISQAEVITGLPILATIHAIEPKVLKKIISKKDLDPTELRPQTDSWDPRIVFRPGLTETLYCEMFRILRASISLLGDENKRSVTLFSSALPGEGKTTVSTNFAIASAQQGRKTLLIDLDLRKPAVHKAFGIKRQDLNSGVTQLLAGQVSSLKEVITEDTGQENLSCLFAGAKAPNPGELLSSEAVSDLLEILKEQYDVIVVDSAPLLAVSDTRLLIPSADNFCLVLRAESTPKGAIRKIVGLLDDDGIQPSGIILNCYEEKANLLTRKHGYGYGYGGYGLYTEGYGYGYGSYGSYGTYGSDETD